MEKSVSDRSVFFSTCLRLGRNLRNSTMPETTEKIKTYVRSRINTKETLKDSYGLNIINRYLTTALIVSEEIGLRGTATEAVLLSLTIADITAEEKLTVEQEIMEIFGNDVAGIIRGLNRVQELYVKNASIETENFRKLLLSFAEDVRVILIMIADRLCLMRMAKELPECNRMQISAEASYLYAPLSHRLGLYSIKSEMEDLALKFRDRGIYDFIACKINETKQSRDKYIEEFISPIKSRLETLNLKFDIKGRTKSINSIRNKLQKQQVEFEQIYDLFAIRVILDTPPEREKADCWQVYSVITDMYQPNPKRLKDWLSIPKSNGYESLHITVMGPEGHWVEVQIRTRRMDEIAERGLAAHWKYKGIKGETGLDEWMNNVREALEHKDVVPSDLIRDFKMNLYDEEIFVFTPKGDLFKLPRNATVLDFAFAVHSRLGCQCVSARINGKNATIRRKLQSGDQVDIQVSQNQMPKQDWLNFVITSKARVKIKQSLKEQASSRVEFAKEALQRRFKNRKIEEDESLLMRFIRKKGYKTVTDFYAGIAIGKMDVNTVVDQYVEFEHAEKEKDTGNHQEHSVEHYVAPETQADRNTREDDVLVIDQNLTGIDYSLAKCCNPIYGDEIFGFVSSKGIKIHRKNCPNAPEMFGRFGYRLVNVRWSGKPGINYAVTLKIVGNDDIGIVTNITSVISKEPGMILRSINVDSSDGLFQGTLTVMLSDTSAMTGLIKKIKAVKGIKQVIRY
ncbi:MAG: HD domain-containing protein [Dysgonamonadaceae bacterium]|jgi:GTP pyrophosphokinase|nr:HD domain-containing protein [Dysgonamonadaceae bacterium]